MTQEALKLALKALEQWYFGCGSGSASHDDAVAAIKEALAQPRYLEIPGMRIDPVTGNVGIGSLPARPQQEPVAQRELVKELADQYARECVEFAKAIPNGAHSMSPIAVKSGDTRLALHTAIDTIAAAPQPAQRTWVGLTHEEHMELMTGTMTISSRMAAVEAKLKEKNT